MIIVKLTIGLVISYLIGSIPTGYLFGRFLKGIDIRSFGSGNMGTTNAFRILGKWPGALVLLIDILKGVIPVVMVADCLGLEENIYRIILGGSAVVGHNWTIFLEFKGGKGVATGLGLLIGLAIKIVSMRMILFLTLLVWGTVFAFSGYVSFASILAACVLPLLMALTSQPLELVILGVFLCVFVVFRHRTNIQRLLSGQEHRVPILFHKKK